MYLSNICYTGSLKNDRLADAIKFIFRGFVIGLLIHFTQIALRGYNGDSLGFGSYYSTYLGELAQGRYGLLLFSERIVNPTIEFIGSIMLYAIASLLVSELVGIEINTLYALLVQLIFMSQPHIATYASFSYASFPYTLAYFLMILAVWFVAMSVNIGEKKVLSVVLGILAVAVSFSIWQAYIPTFTSLIFILLLFGRDKQARIRTIFIAVITAVGGTVLYVIGMKVVNSICGVTPTEARGFADVLSLKLPLFSNPAKTVYECYVTFVKYLLGNSIVYNGLRLAVIHGLLGVCMIAIGIMWIRNKEWKDAIFSVSIFFLAPIALCFYRVISEDVSRIPWTYLHSMIFIWIIFLAMLNRVNIRKKSIHVMIALLIGYVICRQVYICNANYSSLQERDTKSAAMAISMYTRLTEKEDWNADVPIMVVGSMDSIYPDNNWYYETILKGWQPQLNEFLPYSGMPQNWVIMINRVYGTQFMAIDYRWEHYEDVLASELYENMGIWPSGDCMQMIDNVMVIKLG